MAVSGSPISHTTLVAGATVVASTLNTNFNAINSYLDDPGLENQYIENSLHNVGLTWHVKDIATGSYDIGFKVPASFGGAFTLTEAQIYVRDSTTGTITMNIHTAVPIGSGNKIMSSDLVVNEDNEFATSTSFTANSFGGSVSAGNALYIAYVVTTAAVEGMTISLFGKANNRS